MPGHSPSSIRSSSSWKAATSHKHLEGVDKGPVGVRHCEGSPNRFHIKAMAGCDSSHTPIHSRSDRLIREELKELLSKGAVVEVTSPRGGFYSNLFQVPKKDGGQRPVINLSP